tara:strand:+ start:249 stop:875 length:627 start_codon:yes stop_codon:yes gene_type:complete
MKNQYVNGTFSKSYFTASNNFDIKLSKSLCSNIEQWFLDCDDMQALPRNEKGELANKTLKDTNYELLALPKYANEKGKMLKVDIEKKDEIRFFLATNTEYKGKKQIRDLFDNSTVFLNNYMKKFFDYTAPEIVKPEEKPEETTVETDTVETETVQTEEEIMKLAYSNLYNLMAKNNIAMDTFYNYAMQLEEENNINIEKVEELKLKTA